MSLDHAILGFLHEKDLSGYELKTRYFDDRVSHFWTADQAQIYRTLERLLANKLVTARTIRQRDKPDRKVYSITPKGRDVFDSWLSQNRPLPPYRDPFLVQLEFAGQLPDDVVLELLTRERAAHQERLQDLRCRAATYDRQNDQNLSLGSRLHRMTLDAVMVHTRATIDWLDDCIETISSLQGEAPLQRTLFRASAAEGDSQ